MTAPTSPTTSDSPLDSPGGFDEPDSLGRQLRWLLIGLSVAAAGVHFAFAPDHFSMDWRHGTFFVVLAWAQLVWAFLLVVRPQRSLLAAGLAVNLGTIGLWTLSRTAGLPTFAGGNGAAEGVGRADLLCTVFEGAIVVLSGALLALPALARRPLSAPKFAAGLTTGVLAVALVGSSVTINPNYSGSHEHGVEHAAGMVTPQAAGGSEHDMAEMPGMEHGHTTSTTAVIGKAATATDEHAHTAGMPYNGDSPCEQAKTAAPVDEGSDATEGHNHHGALPQKPLDAATRKQLWDQQVQARTVIDRYPTVAAAEADGYRLSTVYLPCIGAHYTKVSLVVGFNPATPSELLYDGTAPDAKIVGLSYLLFHPGGAPEGFAGPNDVWHQHSANGGLCLNPAGVVIGGEQISKATCEKRGGHKNGLKDIWMVHNWVAPGWECSWGVFAAECPELGGKAGGTVWDKP